jgi:N-acetylglucosamine-6-phosphate deacetylase
VSVVASHALTEEPYEVDVATVPARIRKSELSARPGWFLHPGWVDLQVNGFNGHDLNRADLDTTTCLQVARELWREGVTGFLATLITAPTAQVRASLRTLAGAMRAPGEASTSLLGIHLEGPWISDRDGARGAHPAEHTVDPDIRLFDALQDAAEGAIRLVTLAPERPGSIAFIRALRARGVQVALGHTLASRDEFRAAVAAGATLSTHLGNGLPATLPRHHNPLLEQLANDGLAATVIFDGHHLSPALTHVTLRSKGIDRLVMVSDSVSVAHLPAGEYETAVGERVRVETSGRVSLGDTGYLAGSGSSLLDCVCFARQSLGLPWPTIARLAGTHPARYVQGRRGTTRSWTLIREREAGAVEVAATVVEGRVVHVNEAVWNEKQRSR